MKNIISIFILGFLGMSIIAHSQGCAEPSSDEGVTVFGFLQPQMDLNFEEETNATVRFNRMRMGVMGNIPYDFSYYALLETSPFVNQDGQIYLIDAFVSYSRFSFAKVSIGQFKKPFGRELLTPCSGLYTINRSEVVNNLTGPTNRDMGITVLGAMLDNKIKYQVAMMNGAGASKINDNRFFDYYGRVELQPVSFLSVGGSFVYGLADPSVPDSDSNDEKWRYGTDIELLYKGIRLQSEYVFGEDVGSYTTGGGCDGDAQVHTGSIKRDGFLVMAMYNITDNIQPIIKYEEFHADRADDNLLHQTTTFGANFYFNDWTRVQINYLYKAEDPTEIKNDALLMQVQVKF
ncbi:MAG: hypothetical protein JXQ90_04985 [Cyclobacteriaceae bacterium]